MKASSRAPSPTPTAFSGISSYRTDSHRRDAKDAPAVPRINYRKVSEVHYHELGKYLANYLEKGAHITLHIPWFLLQTRCSASKFPVDRSIKVDEADCSTISRTLDGCIR